MNYEEEARKIDELGSKCFKAAMEAMRRVAKQEGASSIRQLTIFGWVSATLMSATYIEMFKVLPAQADRWLHVALQHFARLVSANLGKSVQVTIRVADDLKCVCAWCKKVIREGRLSERGEVSHGICETCKARMDAGAGPSGPESPSHG